MSGKFIWASLTALACTISLLSGYGLGIQAGKSTGLSPMDCFFSMIPCDSSFWKSNTPTLSRPTGSSSTNTCPSSDTSSQGTRDYQSASVKSSSGMTALYPSRFKSPSEIPCWMYALENLPFRSSTEIEGVLWEY